MSRDGQWRITQTQDLDDDDDDDDDDYDYPSNEFGQASEATSEPSADTGIFIGLKKYFCFRSLRVRNSNSFPKVFM